MVIDPREIDLPGKPMSGCACVRARIRPCSRLWARVIRDEGLADVAMLRAFTEDFDAFWQGLDHFAPEDVAVIAGVPADDIRKAARLIARSDNAAFYYTMGVTQHTTGTSTCSPSPIWRS